MEDIHCLAMYNLLLHHHMKPPEKSICGIYVFLASCHLHNKKLLWEKLLWGRSIWWQWQILAHGGFSWGGRHLSSLWEVLKRSARCQKKHPSVAPCLSEQPRVQTECAAVHGTLGTCREQSPAAAAEPSPGRGQYPWESAAVVSPWQEPRPLHTPGRRWWPRQGCHINMEPCWSDCRQGQSLSLLTHSSLASSTLLEQRDCRAGTEAARSCPP